MDKNQLTFFLQNQTTKNSNIPDEMRNGIIIGTIVMGLIIILLVSLYIWHFVSSQKKETIGLKFESEISNELKYNVKVKKINFKYIPGALFEYANGSEKFEIDGILYNEKVFIIIETKYYLGELLGNSTDEKLTLISKKRKKLFHNPITQNLKHINHLYKMCRIKFPVLSMIIFPDELKFKVENINSSTIIANEKNYLELLKKVEQDLEDFTPMSKDIISQIRKCIKDNKVRSHKDIQKWQKHLNENNE
ncbi:NERD domain-containing protein [Mycoplasmopsis phocirhinis]|uniref:NERD domain-containing protein n=1 Tax=Mycoplasmopsis phocirhinis TaxID=142650 RepID=A0A4P6MT15_9BACT|nr:nuclease-related domain-containing protein [Mycoplasmopsis phocirhinis]QBF34447.1 NERD domain-containing protein [Mycoplasmopsis phocirhinis]